MLAHTSADSGTLQEMLLNPGAVGFCTSEGWVRQTNDGRLVSAIEYEAFAPLATSERQAILNKALAQCDITATCTIHRTGHLPVDDLAVWNGVAAPHRDAVFRGCHHIIEEARRRVSGHQGVDVTGRQCPSDIVGKRGP
ncbi:hypothetical protein A0U92_09595 [Acetobacter aceti]|uniref:Molybdopterin synthase catalytic subunit n=2 Tax=Acetobacter aceti TaxID=435 RepID=A0A1U9KGS8_ACEAC|nr:hypothetical protein A0U92_09595 [Acetobacter aceti]